MALTRDFRETVGARYQGDRKYRRVLLAGAVESLLAGEGARDLVSGPSRPGGGVKRGVSKGKKPRVGSGAGYWREAVGRKVLRDFINATIGFPALAEKTGIHVKTLHQMFGPKGNPTAANLFRIIACLQEQEGVRLKVGA
jgi:hypothetical protein